MSPNRDQPFYVSLSVGVEAVGVVLMQKGTKESYMRPIYYISRKRSMVEKAWTQEEKLYRHWCFPSKNGSCICQEESQ